MNGVPALILAISLHVVITLVAAWDIYMAAAGTPEYSVSHIVRRWSVEFPVLPLLVGVVLGHIFWSLR